MKILSGRLEMSRRTPGGAWHLTRRLLLDPSARGWREVTYPDGGEMSTATPAVAVRTVPATAASAATKARFAWVLAARQKAQAAAAWLYRWPKAGWDWMVETFGLGTFLAKAKAGLSWIARKGSLAASYAGRTGTIGLALLAVSTPSGRWILDKVIGLPIRASVRAMGWLTDQTISGLRHLGSPGRWAADRLQDGKNLVIRGKDSVKGFYNRNLAEHFQQNSLAMGAVRMTGTALVFAKVIAWIPIPVVQWIAWATLAGYVVIQGGMIASVAGWLGKERQAKVVEVLQERAAIREAEEKLNKDLREAFMARKAAGEGLGTAAQPETVAARVAADEVVAEETREMAEAVVAATAPPMGRVQKRAAAKVAAKAPRRTR